MGGIDEIRALSLFDGLTDDQLAELVAGSTVVRVEPGAEPFREGEHADFWWVLIDGAIDLVRRVGGEDTVVGKMDVPGRWAGGFRAWDGHGVYLATARASALSRLLRVPAGVLREWLSAWFPLGGHLIAGPLPDRAFHRVDRAAARVPGHPGQARGRLRPRDQQPGGGRGPGGG